MGIAVTLLGVRQNAETNTVVVWVPPEPAARLMLVVARRRLDGDEIEQAVGAGHADADTIRLPPACLAVRDDLTVAGDARYYGVVALADDGTHRPVRFRAATMEAPEHALEYSALGGRRLASIPLGAARPAAGAGPLRGPYATGVGASSAGGSGAFVPPYSTATFEAPAAPADEVALPSEFPVGEFGLRMVGATQTWDGLRIEWEPENRAVAAFEVFVAGHPLSPSEVGELVRGQPVPGAFVRAFGARVKAVIDNLTSRESRAYYAVVARSAEGERSLVGCVARSVDQGAARSVPFFDPGALSEVRGLAVGTIREARVQLMIFREERDVGAWREALRMCSDALAIYPHLPEAMAFEAEVRGARAS